MGSMLPCLVQGSSSILPPMNTKNWSRSMKLLVSKLHHGSNCRAKPASSSREDHRQQTRPHHARARRGLMGSGHQNRRAIRVKVVLTRAEAAQLLSLTAHGHRTAAQVLAELMTRRQTNTSAPPSTTTTAWRPVLESIPEE